MNGSISIRRHIADDFVPSARLNSGDSNIGVTTVAEGAEVITYSAEEARRYVAAFAQTVALHEEAERATGGSEQR